MPKQKSIEENDSPHLVAAYPQALVADVTRAADFYREKLGFASCPGLGSRQFMPWSSVAARGSTSVTSTHLRATIPKARPTC